MMLGWLRAAAAWASARNRFRNIGSSASDGCRSFTATRRFRLTSSATNTTAEAPAPTGATQPVAAAEDAADLLLSGRWHRR